MAVQLTRPDSLALKVDQERDHAMGDTDVAIQVSRVAILLTVALLRVRAGRAAGRLLGTALCAGMAAPFVLSRTTGLPGFREGWSSDSGLGLAALAPEAVLVACAIAVISTYAASSMRSAACGARRSGCGTRTRDNASAAF